MLIIRQADVRFRQLPGGDNDRDEKRI